MVTCGGAVSYERGTPAPAVSVFKNGSRSLASRASRPQPPPFLALEIAFLLRHAQARHPERPAPTRKLSIQGYLAHKKTLTPLGPLKTLGIGLR